MDSPIKRYAIALLPSHDLAKRVISASEKLANAGGQFTLKQGSLYPHLSLYHVNLYVHDSEAAKAMLATVSSPVPQFDLEAKRYSVNMSSGGGRGYSDIEYVLPPELMNFQASVIKMIEAFRADPDPEIGKYRAVGALMRPHITLTRLVEPEATALDVLGDPSQYRAVCREYGFFEIGDHGTCVTQIATWNLETISGSV